MSELDLINSILEDASPFLADQYRNKDTIAVSSKSEVNDLLTEADEAVQRRIVSQIEETYPNDHILAEELGMVTYPEDPNTRCWIIDPIDGTQNFVRGMFPMFGISIAFAENNQVQSGGVEIPLIRHRYLAERDGGATLNGKTIHCSDIDTLAMARVEIDFGQPSTRGPGLDMFDDIMRKAGQVRCHCAAVVGLCSVAGAEMDAYFHTFLNPWDFAASMLIIEEAGGKLSRLDGAPINLYEPGDGVLATNAHLHKECLSVIQHPA